MGVSLGGSDEAQAAGRSEGLDVVWEVDFNLCQARGQLNGLAQ